MNIVIVCVSGMTSSVLARKLNAIAEEKQSNEYFYALGVNTLHEQIEKMDVVLISPQVKVFDNQIFIMLT